MVKFSCGRSPVISELASAEAGAVTIGAAVPKSDVRGPGRGRGFTLLEVLVALLLLSLALAALVRLAGLDARASAQLRDATMAQWVAANVLAETRLRTPLPAIGTSNGEATLGGQRWRWTLVVNATDEPGIRRLDVDVVAVDAVRDTGGVAARLTGFASRP